MSDEDYDSMKAGERVAKMWLSLAETIANGVESLVIDSSDPAKALRWATYAEACFWKATGEADAHDIKNVLPPLSEEQNHG
jgi:hypothetical protein